MKVRSVIAYILFIGMISIFPVAFVLSAAVSDSFANGTLRGRFQSYVDRVWRSHPRCCRDLYADSNIGKTGKFEPAD